MTIKRSIARLRVKARQAERKKALKESRKLALERNKAIKEAERLTIIANEKEANRQAQLKLAKVKTKLAGSGSSYLKTAKSVMKITNKGVKSLRKWSKSRGY